VPTLEAILKKNPRHPGAEHLYIHAVEASLTPGRAEKYADLLQPQMPGAGHLVHMPSHIYNRIGRYADAVRDNQAAAKSDEAYFAATNDLLDAVPVERLRAYEDGLYRFLETRHPDTLSRIAEKKVLDDDVKKALVSALEEYGREFAAGAAAA